MGRVHGQSFKHLRGRVGDFIYKHYGDRVVVTRVPRTTGKRSKRQKASEARFAAASKYAENARRDPELWAFYRKIVGKRKVPTRSVAIRDFMTKPQLHNADFALAFGPHGRVSTWGKPAWKLHRVELEIRDAGGRVLEWGPAQPQPKGGVWAYELTQTREAGTPFVVIVTAYDRLDQKVTAQFAGTFGKRGLQVLPATSSA